MRTKLEEAQRQAKLLAQEGTDGYRNVLRQVFAKLIVGGRTIGKNLNTGRVYITGKPHYQLGRRGKLI